jgi:lipid-A-disaccharide synthase
MPDKRILIVAGETSGDLHGARLVEHLRADCPGLSVYGIGGDAMERAGVRLAFHSSELAVVGVVEVMGRLRTILRAFRWIGRSLSEEPPDLVVLLDFPDFNLRVARQAARRGIPVVYYISPQIWAWRGRRIREIAENIAHMIVIFPFEEALYRDNGVPVTYVGHPLMDRFDPEAVTQERQEAYGRYGLSPRYPILGLFPGSRGSEVRALLPVMLRSARLLRERFPQMQFLLGRGPGLEDEVYQEILEETDIPLVSAREGIGPAMGICDLAVVASGTATLELALLEIPMVVVYRVSWLTYGLGRLLVRVPSIGMVNLVSRKAVVPELIQGDLNEKSLYDLCCPFFAHSIYYAQVKKDLSKVKKLLGEPGASARAARVVREILAGQEPGIRNQESGVRSQVSGPTTPPNGGAGT